MRACACAEWRIVFGISVYIFKNRKENAIGISIIYMNKNNVNRLNGKRRTGNEYTIYNIIVILQTRSNKDVYIVKNETQFGSGID